MGMTETELATVYAPTQSIRESVLEFEGRLLAFLHSHFTVILIVICVIVALILFRKLSYKLMQYRARKIEPVSTNDWFSWEDFEKWKGEKKH